LAFGDLVVDQQGEPLLEGRVGEIAVGKEYKVAIIAVMRKLIAMFNALLRDRRKWTPEVTARLPERRDPARVAVRSELTPTCMACGQPVKGMSRCLLKLAWGGVASPEP